MRVESILSLSLSLSLSSPFLVLVDVAAKTKITFRSDDKTHYIQKMDSGSSFQPFLLLIIHMSQVVFFILFLLPSVRREIKEL